MLNIARNLATSRRCLLVGLAALGPIATCARADEQKRQASWVGTYESASNKDYVYDDEFVKAVKEKLEGRYQNLQVMISACKSGGFADQAFAKWSDSQNWSLTTATNQSKDTFNNEGNAQNFEGHDGLSYPGGYFHGFTPQWLKKINDDANATAVNLYDFAKDKQFQNARGEQSPQFKSRGTGAAAKIHDGSDANYLLFWQSRLDYQKVNLALKAYQIFRGRGYDHPDIDCALLDFA
ncbi:MAG: C13 family peptidase, partial [Tepidisphaeraceae bacterium]